MITRIRQLCHHRASRLILNLLILPFVLGTTMPARVSATETTVAPMPQPGNMVSTTERFVPTLLRGIMINPSEPFQLDFIVDTGQSGRKGEALEEEKIRLIKYFMASLTVPEDDLWVNLSPFEQQRIIPEKFGFTDMGRDLLAQDYLLKQLTATLMYPEEQLGQSFWDRIYRKAQERYGTTDVPVNTFNKVWIVPEEAVIYEQGNAAYIVKTHLKVMLEEDYIALDKNLAQRTQAMGKDSAADEDAVNSLASEVIRDIILPEIEEEVNHGRNFATLRQIYYSLILASWYKESIKQSLINQLYSDQNKINGIDIDDREAKERIYRQYIAAFEEGVYDYIKEELDPVTQEVIPRKYFSGGVRFRMGLQSGVIRRATDSTGVNAVGDTEMTRVGLLRSNRRERAVLATNTEQLISNGEEQDGLSAALDEWFTRAERDGLKRDFERSKWERGRSLSGTSSLIALRARDDGRVIGLASYRIGVFPSTEPEWLGQQIYFVDYIEVSPEFRGEGYSKVLFGEVIQASLEDQAWQAQPDTANPGALVLNPAGSEEATIFGKLGFRELPRDTSDDQYVYDSESLLWAQRFFYLSPSQASALWQEAQVIRNQPEEAERSARLTALYEAQAGAAESGQQLDLFPDGVDNLSSDTDKAVLSGRDWQRFVPFGIQESPAWVQDQDYQTFSQQFMGTNNVASLRMRTFSSFLDEAEIKLPERFERGIVLGFGEGVTELALVKNAFNVNQLHGVEWVGERVRSAAQEMARSGAFLPNQYALHHANMKNLNGEFGAGVFDFVYVAHISDDNQSASASVAKEIVRILAPGGVALIDEGNPEFLAYLGANGQLTQYLTSEKHYFQKAGSTAAVDDTDRTGLTAQQTGLLRNLGRLGVISPDLSTGIARDRRLTELLAQSELFQDNPLVKNSAGYRPTDSIDLIGDAEVAGRVGAVRLRTENQYYFKALNQHAPEVVAYARFLLDNPAYAGKKFVALGRGADLIYDALTALTYLDGQYAARRGDITILDFSSEEIADLGTPANIEAYGAMFRRQLGRQLGISTYDNLVFVNEVASEQNATQGLLQTFIDAPFDYSAGVTYDNIEARRGTRYDGSRDTSAFDWLDTDYRSGRRYDIQAFPVFGIGHSYQVEPFQRFLNQEAVYAEAFRQSRGVSNAVNTGARDNAVLSVSESEWQGVQRTLQVMQTVAEQLDIFVTSRELRAYQERLDRWNRDVTAYLADAEQTGEVAERAAALATEITALNARIPKKIIEDLRPYTRGETSFAQLFADQDLYFFAPDESGLRRQSSDYVVYDYIDKLNKALASTIFAGDAVTENVGGTDLENLRIAQTFAGRGLKMLDAYFTLLDHTLNPGAVNVESFEVGLEKDAFPETAYTEFLLPYVRTLAARTSGATDLAVIIRDDIAETAAFLDVDAVLVRDALRASLDVETGLKRFAAQIGVAPEAVVTILVGQGLAQRNPQSGDLGFDLTDAFFEGTDNTSLLLAEQNRFAELSLFVLEELNEQDFADELKKRGVDLDENPIISRGSDQESGSLDLPVLVNLIRRSKLRAAQRSSGSLTSTQASPLTQPQLEPQLLRAYESYMDLLGNVLSELQGRRAGDQVWFIFDNQYWDRLPAASMAIDKRTGDFLIHLHTSEGDLTRGFMFRINPDAQPGEAIFDKFWIEDSSSQGFVSGDRFVQAGYITQDFADQLLEDATAVMRQDDGFSIMDRYSQMRQDFYPLMQEVIRNNPQSVGFQVGAVQDARQQDVLINIFRPKDVRTADENGNVQRVFTGPESERYDVSYKVTSDAAVLPANPVGGIDLTPNNLNIEVRRDPKGVPVPLSPQQIQDVNIDGLYPVIINTIPITNVPLLLGIADRAETPTDLSQRPDTNPVRPPANPDQLSFLQ